MSTQLSAYLETAVLDAIFNDVSPSALQLSTRYIKLHIGAPGSAGTANPAANTTRKAITSEASSSGVFTSGADITWTSVSNTETYTDVSIWDASTSGNCLAVGSLSASKAVTSGDTFTIPSGSLTVTLT